MDGQSQATVGSARRIVASMWIQLACALLLTSCGSTVAASRTSVPPSRTPASIPWIADGPRQTPLPIPTVPQSPSGIRSCVAADIRTLAPRGQGAGGWATRPVIFANGSATPCVISGPTTVAYLDGAVTVIARAWTPTVTWSIPGWVVLDPGNVLAVGPHPGQASLLLLTYGDCDHRMMNAIAITFPAPTGTITVPVEPQRVSGRCDMPGQPLMLGWGALAPTQLPDYPTLPSPPFSYRIEAPAVAVAGEPLHYVIWARNTSATPYTWSDGCPVYLAWLGGREVSPTEVPGHLSKTPPERKFAGVVKDSHPLNCTAAGIVAPNAELAFEMRIDVPRDAYGPDTLRWEIVFPPVSAQINAPIEFLAPRR